MNIGAVLPAADEHTVKTEPMLHRASRNFAKKNGGPLTRQFIKALPWTDEILIDSRVHMLMPGMWPCIPGWHHDDVPRSREDGQPNYVTPEYKSEHCMALWGDCSLTEFAVGRADFAIPDVGEKIYKKWDKKVEYLCNVGRLTRQRAPDRQLVFFDWLSWHRGMPTTKKGFRFFIRATRKSRLEARNEIRYNANVYMPVLTEGW
jgi:hypothetical protein